MKNKKGFTLIELLAVIIILAIILAIAVPKILLLIDKSRESANETSKKLLMEAIKIQVTNQEMYNSGDLYKENGCYLFNFDNDVNNNVSNLKLKNKEQFKGSITYSPSTGFQDDSISLDNNYAAYKWKDAKSDGYNDAGSYHSSANWFTTLNPESKVYLRTDGTTPEVCGVFPNETVCLTSSYYNNNYSSYRNDFKDCTTNKTIKLSNINNSCLTGYAKAKAEEILLAGASQCDVYSSHVTCGGTQRCFVNDKGNTECEYIGGSVGCYIDSNGNVYCRVKKANDMHVNSSGGTY